MLENSPDHFNKWIKSGDKVVNFEYLGNNISEVYSNFINKKFEIYFKEKSNERLQKQTKFRLRRSFDKDHRDLAIKLGTTKLTKDLTEYQQDILSVGIVQIKGGNIEFIHQTFREYFFADLLAHRIKKEPTDHPNENKQKFLLTKILMKQDYQLIRTFLNFQIEKIKSDANSLENYKDNLKQYGDIMSKLWQDNKLRKDGETALHIAAEENNTKFISFLLDSLKNDPKDGWTSKAGLLQRAASNGKLDVVKYLIGEQGADYKTPDKNGSTILHTAASNGKLDVVKYLIEEKGADYKTPDTNGSTILHYSAENGQLDVVKYLIEEKGADFKTPDEYGSTPLERAARNGKLDVVKYLIEYRLVGFGVVRQIGQRI